jgi:hypothetical protein
VERRLVTRPVLGVRIETGATSDCLGWFALISTQPTAQAPASKRQ